MQLLKEEEDLCLVLARPSDYVPPAQTAERDLCKF